MKTLIVSFVLVTLFLSIAGIGMVTASEPNNAQAEKLSLPENAVEVSPGFFYLGKSMDKGNVVEGYAFVHYVKPAASSKPVFDDTVDINKFIYGGIKWADTMQYKVNPSGSGLNDDVVIATLTASLETWDAAIAETPSSFELFDDTLPITEEVFDSGDGINTVTWDDLGSSGIIAANYFWFYSATKEMIESDVRFNTYYDWSVDDTCSGDIQMDLQSIATHEFGHNGLNDLYMSPSVELTMHGWTYESCETKKRDLGTGDISGIQALYGG